MPSFHSDELNNRTLDDPFFQTLNDTRQSQENAALKNWPLQQPIVHANYETTPPRTPTDSLNSMNDEITPPDNGGMFTDTGLNAVPNGRSARNSWEDRLVRNTGALSINGGMAGIPENGRKSPEPHNRSSKSLSTERNSYGIANGYPIQPQLTVPEVNESQAANGYNESYKRLPPPPSSYNPQSTGPLTYSSSLVGNMKHLDSPPTTQNAQQNPSIHRLSPDYNPRTPIGGPSGSSQNAAGPPQLKQRVPKIGPPRASTDDGTALATGRFSPVAATSNMRRGSLSINRRNTQSIHSNIPHEDIAQDEDALRWAEAIRQKRASKRKRRDEEDEDRVVVGTKVDQNHVNWVTAYNMLTGIRFTVSRTNAKLDRDLTEADFTARHKFSFDITGNELTPSAKYDFKFKDYAPWIFRRLRATFKIDPADYLMSLTSKYILSELGSPGKSGSFFYFSRDYKYIIKTIHHAEHKLLRKILKDYYQHVVQNPNTLLSQFYGLHRVKVPYGGKIHFVVMNNLFPPHRDIHQTFDLKGSTIGRDYKEENVVNNPRATLKDLNWLRRNYHLEFGPEKKNTFLEQMEQDVHLLQKLKIMDYSMLVGIHDLGKGNQENLRDKTLRVFQPGGDTSPDDILPSNPILTRTPSKLETARKAHELRKIIKHEKPIPMGESSTRMPDQMEENTSKRDFTFYSDDGGFRATHEDNTPGEEIYYLGIIDLLTHYGTVKRLENFWKGLSHDKQQISPIPPVPYGDRFIKFVMDITKSREEVREEVRDEVRDDVRGEIREENEEAMESGNN
ncbi:Phosphatidylinositol-4-phosphate 5-kinase [Pseudogymnoascus verrucosus]|uniref:1-phosphatidylinositol-4-phosphate 5-kinase n=1 Tax=Pseudogymnoascus verrucosus TaxID=342668 RepID=A0A1B8GFU2_9PEZI|nr:Phosphatidylinositol-4-phosphate 5-kinase [Pseudogymnoascus verrucosus]OBT94694.1 Phosphatidylinositol-4-phosphate 5-kinase [Pseudogymnoascus verrucosus]